MRLLRPDPTRRSPDPLAGKGGGAPGMASRKGETPGRGGEEERGRRRGKLLPPDHPDVRFYG